MAGFVGFFNFDDLFNNIKNSMNKICYRGKHFFCVYSKHSYYKSFSLDDVFSNNIIAKDFIFGYLGSNNVEIARDGRCLVLDSNIYNWKQLNEKYLLNANNEFDFLYGFLDKFCIDKIDELKGSYAFAYFNDNKLYLFRDVIGIKPICFFGDQKSFGFGSELKALPYGAIELNPRQYIIYDCLSNKFEILNRKKYYNVNTITDGTYLEVKQQIRERFLLSVKKELDTRKIGVLFSGGTDSTLMALTLREIGVDFTCYTASIGGGNITQGEDIYYARKIAAECNFDWRLVEIGTDEIVDCTRKVIGIIETTNYVKVSVALPLFIALREACKDGVEIMFSGIGSEEVFADYKRAQDIKDINAICLEGLGNLWIRDLYRDDTIASFNGIGLKFPFLEDDFVNYCIKIQPDYKITKVNNITTMNKVIVRDILNDFGLSYDLVYRPKKAAQYGSRSDRAFEKLARKSRLGKQAYLNSL